MNQTQLLLKDKLDGWTLRDLTFNPERTPRDRWDTVSGIGTPILSVRISYRSGRRGIRRSSVCPRPRLFPCTVELVRWIRCQRKGLSVCITVSLSLRYNSLTFISRFLVIFLFNICFRLLAHSSF